MSKKEEILRVAVDGAHTVYAHHMTAIDTNNGMLNEGKLEREKDKVFRHATKYLQEEMVTETQLYPVSDISGVMMDIDFVAVHRNDWSKIINFLAGDE